VSSTIGAILIAVGILGLVLSIPGIVRALRVDAWGLILVLPVVVALALAGFAGDPADTVPEVAWVVTGAVLAAVFAGNPVVVALLRRALGDDERMPLPASVWIGIVERLGLIVALLMAMPSVAALLLGIKALGIYVADRRGGTNALSAERVVGTLASVTWALLCFAVVAIQWPAVLGLAG
jgi:hypothetical protein